MDLVALTRKLVDIESITGNEGLVGDAVHTELRHLGFESEKVPVEGHRCNVYATSPQHTRPEIVFSTHMDTVPPFIPSSEDATCIYGRGSCDTKGFIAAALSAVETIDLKTLNKPVALIFTADEEIGLRGAKHLAQLNPFRVRYSIVGEPTSLQPIRAGKGYSLAEVTIKGREAHSAYPALGASAVFRAARLINRLEKIAETLKSNQHEAFDPSFTTLNVGVIHGGSAKNVLAGECRFTLEWRPIPTQPSERVLHLLNAAINEEQRADPDFVCEVDASRADSGFETPVDSRVIKLLERATGRESGTVAFGTEGAQMRMLGSEPVVIGPGDIREAHRTGEFVPVQELEACTRILQQAVRELCG